MPELTKQQERISRFLKRLILLFISAFVLITLIVMLFRINYPYQLEWMEGGEIEHIIRLLEGKNIYTEPSLEFIPYIYTPFFYYIGAGMSYLFGTSLATIRFLSLFSFILSLVFTYKIIFFITKDHFWSIVGVGIYVLSFSTTGFWFDLARVDSLANLLIIISFYFLLKETKRDIFFSAVFSFLAFYTKQSYLLVTIFLIIPLFIQKKKLAFFFSTVYFALVITSTVVESILSNGWYFFWNFYFPSTHHWIWSRAITFWTVDILPFYSISFAIILAYILLNYKSIFVGSNSYFIFLLLGTMLSSYFTRLHYGGFLNVLMPLVFAISVFFPIVSNGLKNSNFPSNSIETVLVVLAFFQLILLIYDPIYPIPKDSDKKDVEQVFEFAKSVGGDVYLMGYNFVQRDFGLPSLPHYVLLNDLFISNVPQKQKLIKEFEIALKEKKFKTIILDDDLSLDLIDKYYRKTEKVFYHRVLNSKSSPYRREVVWVPK
ncbi:MAG: hypothetical protein CH6_2505 [Candidatus Kapaibacterium sp.]|nr:MAG: hypothetical protein CH6_2505 [Candidatus Kapabacteria bacterium]